MFHCFICNESHHNEMLGGFVGECPVCEGQLALIVALGDKMDGQEIVDLRPCNLTKAGKDLAILRKAQLALEVR